MQFSPQRNCHNSRFALKASLEQLFVELVERKSVEQPVKIKFETTNRTYWNQITQPQHTNWNVLQQFLLIIAAYAFSFLFLFMTSLQF